MRMQGSWPWKWLISKQFQTKEGEYEKLVEAFFVIGNAQFENSEMHILVLDPSLPIHIDITSLSNEVAKDAIVDAKTRVFVSKIS